MNDIIDIGEAEVPAVNDIDTEIVNDIEEARETYKDLITKGKEGLVIAYTVMEGSQHPRATETFAGLLNVIANINKNLIIVYGFFISLMFDLISFIPFQNNIISSSEHDLISYLIINLIVLFISTTFLYFRKKRLLFYPLIGLNFAIPGLLCFFM